MKGTLGEIRIFASDLEPRGWAFCRGKLLSISQNTVLYSIIGKNYGGDGKNNFSLPDFRGKAAVGVGHAPGLSRYDLGKSGGAEGITLTSGQASHTHPVIYQPAAPGTTKATLYGVQQNGDSADPGGNFLAEDTNIEAAFYAGSEAGSALTPLNAGSIKITKVTGPRLDKLEISPIGFGASHNNIQPCLALNFIICIEGDFPPRQ